MHSPLIRQRVAAAAGMAGMLFLAACGPHTAAEGTIREAKAVVQVIYGQLSDESVNRLPFTAGQISPAVKRLRARLPELRPWLDAGAIGVAANGLLRIRTFEGVAAAEQAALKRLVRAENRDRLILYGAHAEDVGHGSDMFGDNWMAYEGATFSAEWVGQAPAGWWVQDDSRRWSKKTTAPVKPD